MGNTYMTFGEAPRGARFKFPNLYNDEIWIKINSYPKSRTNDGLGLIVQWNGNVKGHQSHCSWVDVENGMTFDTLIELV